jgi:hypothetical protein
MTAKYFENAARVRARGWSYSGVSPLIDLDWPELVRIPPDADLFDSDDFEGAAVTALTSLYGHRGIQIANAGKLFYQKRPGLIPILDNNARQALNVPWLRTNGGEEVFRLGFQRIREVTRYSENRGVLEQLHEWVSLNPSLTGGLTLSRLRILDILAWGIIRRMLASDPAI